MNKTMEKPQFRLMEIPQDLLSRGRQMVGMGHEIWLAGLGAVVTMEEEGSSLFSTLVKRGEKLETEGKKKLIAVREDVTGRQKAITHTVEGTVYEPLLRAGRVVYAGVDYERILREAEREADVLLWDGGNNDMPFFVPDLLVTVVDPHRADHAAHYHPGETVVRMADAIVINKVDTATPDEIANVRRVVRELNPRATVVEAASPISVEDGVQLRDKRVLVVEDGPTVTHGGMPYGAGWVAARSQ